MHLLHLLPLALLSHAHPDLFPRQAIPLNGSTLTSPPALSSAAFQIITQNLPTSILPSLAIAIQSAAASASITGNINSIVTSVLTAATPPPFLTAIPSQYQSRLSVIEKSLGAIRSEAEAATAKPTSTLRALGGGNATVVSTITTMGSTLTTSLVATVVNGSTSVVGAGNGTMVGGMTSSAEATGSGAGGPPAPTSTTGSGMAAATRVPLAAVAAGAMGFLAAAVVL
ncbi:MAG: hypothetical protein Q9219_006906 [cf. Caloplaca sp. 3 TL-2023]